MYIKKGSNIYENVFVYSLKQLTQLVLILSTQFPWLLSFCFCFVLKVSGGTEVDLTVKARRTELYVCRVNDHDGNAVFSDWVKVKVLDIDKSGMHCALSMLVSFLFFFVSFAYLQFYSHVKEILLCESELLMLLKNLKKTV